MINLRLFLPLAILMTSSSNAFQSQLPSRQLKAANENSRRRTNNFRCNRLVTKVNNDENQNVRNIIEENNHSENMFNYNKNQSNNRRSFLASATATVLSSLSSVALSTNSPAQAATAASTVGNTAEIITPTFTKELSWPLGKVAFSLLPLAATSTRRATVEECLVEDTIWTHDQIQGVVNVNVPVRQIVVKLSKEAGGGLLVYNPVAPTPQLLDMMHTLEKKHGPVRHIILGTVALEHKATFGPFAQYFPDATVWLQPGQWAFPINLPIELSGVTQRGSRLREIPKSDEIKDVSRQYRYYAAKNPIPEWKKDLDYEMLGPLEFQSVGAFSETALFHKKSKTLLVTDSVVSVTDTPPKIISEDPRAMLFHARDSINDVIEDTEENRKKGWRRMVQFGLVFFPSQIDVVPFSKAISEASQIDPKMKPLGDGAVPFSLYPWTWHDNDADLSNFNEISKGGEIFCPPILTKLILDREPQKTLDWADRICSRFDFNRIIPCHLNNYVKATPDQFRDAFKVLANKPGGDLTAQRSLPQDLALLQKASDILTTVGVVGDSQVCDGEPARDVGRFSRR